MNEMINPLFGLALANFWEHYANGRFEVAREQGLEIVKLARNPFKNGRAQIAFQGAFVSTETLAGICKDIPLQAGVVLVVPPEVLATSTTDNLSYKN